MLIDPSDFGVSLIKADAASRTVARAQWRYESRIWMSPLLAGGLLRKQHLGHEMGWLLAGGTMAGPTFNK